MHFPSPLVRGMLIRRYKRFLADVTLETGEILTAHCANPGAMTGLAMPGLPVWLSKSDDPKRKLAYSLELVELPTGIVGINTAHPNRIVGEALRARSIPELGAYDGIRPEVKYAEKSRVDFLLTAEGLPDCYLEVKNVHLVRAAGLAEFPDSVTTRGARHLADLARMVDEGHRAVMLYLVQRGDCTQFTLAADIDRAYAAAFRDARSAGVEALCHATDITSEAITLGDPLPIRE
ncbi:DNA/RNA nuclease SfsA [Pelagibacterium flavum]|uniref:Sugar fermentation stimulation protein homolog n=1 Tax=Pelagibacterium flavum TaxID=2984530 RepID=A0ABY6ITA1_9HYPH|nr:DNA/RNA nuclease SfsA [Pelagibacterium sp. YIM 151497]MAN78421.1 DNA/RNA nuclease SfsA [Hyphomicrobiales bacterium]UYQ73808.1 DNA/RNA nuclease SfsA [Pelagibacterium sp. YIM 151497]|tara:strand:- start:31 stop:732 length:702 start_codon:yes stop_codon:yes gene_type:complete